ncbi:MAG: ATP-binding protein [Bacteroidales bacterium]|nr:ATP-binding protein [Bacteroidales bacterium]
MDYKVHRNLFDEVEKHLKQKEITIISGLRQTGKSTLLHQLKTKLEKENQNTIFLNFDFDGDKKFLQTQEALVNKLKFEFGNEKAYVFIDEIQRRENAGLYLKGIYDLNLPYKFIVSGSGSIELKEKITESLLGRKRVFELLPVNFSEFVDYKTDYKYTNRLSDFFEYEPEKTDLFLIEYLNYGGLPRIVTETSKQEKIQLINEIYNSYIDRDLVSLLNINNPVLFKNIFRMLAAMSGRLLNYSELASDAQTSVQTLKNYLYFAEKTYSLKIINPYFNNLIKEIKKSSSPYFNDIGMMNYAAGKFGNLANEQDLGFVFQNFIFNELRNKIQGNTEIKFWRTSDKAEVDFIIDKITETIPIEIKFKHLKKDTVPRSLRSYIQKYKPKIALIVNLSFNKEIKIDNTIIRFISYTKFISEDLF